MAPLRRRRLPARPPPPSPPRPHGHPSAPPSPPRPSGSRLRASPAIGTKRRLAASGSRGARNCPRSLVESMPTTRCNARAPSKARQALGQHLRRPPGCGRRRARARCRAAAAATSGPAARRCRRAGQLRFAQTLGRSPCWRDRPRAAAALPPPRARHCRSGGCRPAPGAAGRAGDRASRPRGRSTSPRRPSRGHAAARVRRSRPPGPRSPPAPRAAAAAITAGTPGLRMPAFSKAIWPACRPDSSRDPARPARSGTAGVAAPRWWRRAGRRARSPAAPSRRGARRRPGTPRPW